MSTTHTKYLRIVLVALLSATLLVPSSALAKPTTTAKGSLSYEMSGTIYRYEWNVVGGSGKKAADGWFTFENLQPNADGTTSFIRGGTWPVTRVSRPRPGVIDFYAPGSWGVEYSELPLPWATGAWRVVSDGEGGGELWAFCFLHEDYHGVATLNWDDVRTSVR